MSQNQPLLRFSSLVAGVLADWFGRKTMMIVSALMFVASVALIVISQGFLPLFLGRLLQGMSGGVIAVVVPLYLAECLSAKIRGKGAAIFQFMLTFGIVVAAVLGLYYTRGAESAIAAAAGNEELIKAAQNHAWRGMFWTVIYPGLIFFVGAFFVSESPRWLFRRGKKDHVRAHADAHSLHRHGYCALVEPGRLDGHRCGVPANSRQLRYSVMFLFWAACTVIYFITAAFFLPELAADRGVTDGYEQSLPSFR